jgi:type VI protein secretion system component Hcp
MRDGAAMSFRPLRASLALAIAFAAIGAATAAAADGVYAVFADPKAGALAVKGTASDSDMAKLDALEVNEIDFGIEKPLVLDPRQGAVGPGRPSFRPLSLSLPLGAGVAALLQTSGTGGHYGDVTVHFRTTGDKPVEYATLALKLVAVTKVEIAAEDGDRPRANVALIYGAMKLDVFPLDATGTPASTPETGQWSVVNNSTDFSKVPKP